MSSDIAVTSLGRLLIKDFQDTNKPIIRLLSAADTGYTFYHPTLITNTAVIVSHDTENLIINNYGNSADESKNNLISINLKTVTDLYGKYEFKCLLI